MLKNRLLISASALALAAGILPAHSADQLVTSGTTSGPVGLFDGDTLTVESDGAVEGGGADAAFLGSTPANVEVINGGTINSTGANAIDATIGSLLLTNSGAIYAATDSAVIASSIPILFNAEDAAIYSIAGIAVESSAAIGTIDNSGSIVGLTDAVVTPGGIVSIVNNSTGAITGMTGIGIDTHIIGDLNNAGTISGGVSGIEASISFENLVNTNYIYGDTAYGVLAGALLTVDNRGFIYGGDVGLEVTTTLGSLVNAEGAAIGALGGSYGIHAGTIGYLENAGYIIGNQAVFSAASGGTYVNSGTIAGDSMGIITLGGSGTSVFNSGTIGASTGYAIFINGGSIENSGVITAPANTAVFSVNLVSLVNSGQITGLDGVAAQKLGYLRNSGLIAGATPGNYAIRDTNGDTVLVLDAGSILIGRVDIAGGNDTLNVGNGLNLALTFDDGVPETIETNGAPHVVDGLTVHVVDPSGVGPDTHQISDLAGSIAGAVGHAVDPGAEEKGAAGGQFWIEGIGGAGAIDGADGGSDASHQFAGLAAGLGFLPELETRAGFFLGAAGGRSRSEMAVSDTDSYFGGAYVSRQFEDFRLDGVFTAGHSRAGAERTIADNTVETGLTTADSTRGAWFVAPSLTASRPFVAGDMQLRSSLSLGYVGVFAQGYSENGGPAPFAIGAGSSHVFEARALVSVPSEAGTADGVLTTDIHGGVEARALFRSGDLDATLAGLPVTIAEADTAATAGLTGGASFRFKRGGMSFFGGGDATVRSDASYSLTGRIGLKGSF